MGEFASTKNYKCGEANSGLRILSQISSDAQQWRGAGIWTHHGHNIHCVSFCPYEIINVERSLGSELFRKNDIFQNVLKPLFNLPRVDIPISGGKKHDRAFDLLKNGGTLKDSPSTMMMREKAE